MAKWQNGYFCQIDSLFGTFVPVYRFPKLLHIFPQKVPQIFKFTFFFQSGPDANLNRFQGSSSISSADYFGRTETTPAGRGLQTPDMEDVKESVRQGVTKVAGRLSGIASGALSSIQVGF